MSTDSAVTQRRFVAPETVTTHFHIRRGDVVGDFGTGSGFFLPVLSKSVGADGRVYAFEIQKQLVERAGEIARHNDLTNVEALWCDIEEDNGVKVVDGSLDVALLVNVLFQTEDREAVFREIHRTLRHGGKLFVIDWTEPWGGIGPHPDQVVTADAATAHAETCGFIQERTFDAGDHHYGLAFRKP